MEKIPVKWTPIGKTWCDNCDGTESRSYCAVGTKVSCAAEPKLSRCITCKQLRRVDRDKRDYRTSNVKAVKESYHAKRKEGLFKRLFGK